GVPLQAEQADWLEDTDEEIDEQELEAIVEQADWKDDIDDESEEQELEA
ncbi:hypothetical protein Tco_0287936, partial [Tanacetum coccineum]